MSTISMYGRFCMRPQASWMDALVYNIGSKIIIWGVWTLIGSLGLAQTKDFHEDFDGRPTIFIEFFEVNPRFSYMFGKHTIPVWRVLRTHVLVPESTPAHAYVHNYEGK